MLNRALFVFISLFLIVSSSYSQDVENGNLRDAAIKVFLDCHRCDDDFIKREIPYVNYVRDRKEAQVHILVTQESTGSGGTEYQINFIGQQEYQGIEDRVIYVSTPDETSDVRRQGRTNMMALGLMQFVSKTPLASKLSIKFDDNGQNKLTDEVVVDKLTQICLLIMTSKKHILILNLKQISTLRK